MTNPRLLFAVTDPITALSFLRGQLSYLRKQGFETHLACARTPELEAFAAEEQVILHDVPLGRTWGHVNELRSLWKAVRVLRQVRPDVLNYSTPKAALIWAVASWFARPRRVCYLLRGLRLEGERRRSVGFLVLWLMEFLAARTADITVCVSASLRRRALELRIVRASRAVLLGPGSSNGVDAERFSPPSRDQRRLSRGLVDAAAGDCVIGFVGRLARDKGIDELLDAVELCASQHPVRCVLVGSPEPDFDLSGALDRRPAAAAVTTARPATRNVEQEYAAFDVFVLPSHREGLSNALLEAQAMAIPCITTRATGCSDAISPGVSGLVVNTGDAAELAAAIAMLAGDSALRSTMGASGRERVTGLFQQEHVWHRYAELYESVAATKPTSPKNEASRHR